MSNSASFPPGYAQEDNSHSLYAVAIVFIILEILFFSLRTYGRYLTNAKIGVDDVLMIPALLTVIGAAALCIGTHSPYQSCISTV